MAKQEPQSLAARKTPPGPDSPPVVGHALQIARDPWSFYDRLSEHGDVVAYELPGMSFCTVLDPEAIERVLVTDADAFGKFGFEQFSGSFAPEGLLLTEGDQWRRQRSVTQEAFTLDRIQQYGERMAEYADDLVDAWDDGETVAVNRAFSRLTLRILARSLFDVDVGGPADPADDGPGPVVTDFAETINDRGSIDGLSTFLPMWVPTPQNRRYRRRLSAFRSFVEELIDERRNDAADRDDLLSLLLTTTADGEGLSEVEVRDTLATFLFAGHETTALALTYALLEFAQHDGVRRRLDDEYDRVLGGSAPGPAEVAELSYADRVLSETLRLYPPAFMIFREARRDVAVGGYRIPEGTKLTLPQFHVQTDERWYDDPETFDPDRWTDGFEASLPEYAYFPFGGGPRHCIGMRFARMELQVVLATLLKRVRFELLSDPDPELEMGAAMRPAEDVRMRIRKR